MKLRMFNNIKTLPKKAMLFGLASVVALSALAGPLVVAQEQVTWEGWTKSRNMTAGETEYKDVTNAKVDEVVQVQLWHHNRENPAGPLAQNTRVKFNVPNTQGKSHVITGTSSADNAPAIVDTTTVNTTLDRNFVEYIPGTAKFRYNKGAADGNAACETGFNFPPASCYATVGISDSVVTTGVNLDTIRGGPLRGCNAHHETVTIQVRIKAPVVSMNKFVRHAGQTSEDWKTETQAKPGDDLEYMIRFKNEGNTKLEDVMVGDNLPFHHTYVNGSTKLKSTAFPNGTDIANDNITKGGINVGHYMPGSVAYVLFKVKLDDADKFEKCGVNKLINVGVVRPKGMNEHFNTAIVRVDVPCKPGQPKVTPEQPQALPQAGPADTAAIFVIVSAASGLAYRVFIRRFYGEA